MKFVQAYSYLNILWLKVTLVYGYTFVTAAAAAAAAAVAVAVVVVVVVVTVIEIAIISCDGSQSPIKQLVCST
jgi:cobalamin biosynthesis protein CbiD